MFRLAVLIASLFAVGAFQMAPANSKFGSSSLQMSAEKLSMPKVFGAALIASSMLSMPVFAVEGAGAKLGIFSNAEISSPFPQAEKREDPIYSAYSPYGDGTAAVYKKNGEFEVKLNKEMFEESAKRTTRVPGYAAKKQWNEITTELTRYTYNMRSSMLKVAENSKSPEKSTAAAKAYFSDINDIFEFASKKDGAAVNKAYEKSVTDLAAFQALI